MPSRVTCYAPRQLELGPYFLLLQRRPYSRRFELVAHNGRGSHLVGVKVDGISAPSFISRTAGWAWIAKRNLRAAVRTRAKAYPFGAGLHLAESVTLTA